MSRLKCVIIGNGLPNICIGSTPDQLRYGVETLVLTMYEHNSLDNRYFEETETTEETGTIEEAGTTEETGTIEDAWANEETGTI